MSAWVLAGCTVALSIGLSTGISFLVTQRQISAFEKQQQAEIEAAKNEPGSLLKDALDPGLFKEEVDEKYGE